MLEIKKDRNEKKFTVSLIGRLDTGTAPDFEQVVKNELNDVTELTIDLSDLEYISSAGLRVLLAAQKIMNQQGSMSVANANEEVREVFDITGFADILHLA